VCKGNALPAHAIPLHVDHCHACGECGSCLLQIQSSAKQLMQGMTHGLTRHVCTEHTYSKFSPEPCQCWAQFSGLVTAGTETLPFSHIEGSAKLAAHTLNKLVLLKVVPAAVLCLLFMCSMFTCDTGGNLNKVTHFYYYKV